MAEKILDAVHETAQGLHRAGVMSKVTLREFDALCLPTVKVFTAIQIRKLREKEKMSQTVFAAFLNTSPSTIRKWEGGEKKPNGPSLKLLNLIDQKGIDVLR